jgi:hypothetical protein
VWGLLRAINGAFEPGGADLSDEAGTDRVSELPRFGDRSLRGLSQVAGPWIETQLAVSSIDAGSAGSVVPLLTVITE